MKFSRKPAIVAVVFFIIGTWFVIRENGLGIIEWLLIFSGLVFGFAAGRVQTWSVFKKNQGEMGKGEMILWWIGAIVLLIIIKAILPQLIPSKLNVGGYGFYAGIEYTIAGLFLGRSVEIGYNNELKKLK